MDLQALRHQHGLPEPMPEVDWLLRELSGPRGRAFNRVLEEDPRLGQCSFRNDPGECAVAGATTAAAGS